MKLTQLRDVIAVAERGSLRAAARHLGVHQPAITRSIRELEQELGVVLFEREAKGAVLTPMGALFLRRASVVQNELRQASEEIDQHRGQTHGRVSAMLSIASHIALLPRALPPFVKRFPDASLNMSEGLFAPAEVLLKEGRIDFYVGPLSEATPPRELAVEMLFDNHRIIFGRKGHPLRGARSLAELGGASWMTTNLTANFLVELGPLFERNGLPPPKVAMQTDSALSMIMACAHTDYLLMLPEQWLEFPAVEVMLEPIFVVEDLPAPPLCIVHRGGLPLTPAAEYLCDMIRRASEYHVADRAKRRKVLEA